METKDREYGRTEQDCETGQPSEKGRGLRCASPVPFETGDMLLTDHRIPGAICSDCAALARVHEADGCRHDDVPICTSNIGCLKTAERLLV